MKTQYKIISIACICIFFLIFLVPFFAFWGAKEKEENNNIDTYSIIFDSRGGIECAPIETNREEMREIMILNLPIPTREDYVFCGWYNNTKWEEADLEGVIFLNQKTVKSMTLYARWGIKEKIAVNTITSVREYLHIKVEPMFGLIKDPMQTGNDTIHVKVSWTPYDNRVNIEDLTITVNGRIFKFSKESDRWRGGVVKYIGPYAYDIEAYGMLTKLIKEGET